MLISRRCVQRSQAGQRDAGRRGTHQDRRLRNVQGGHRRRPNDENVLRHAGLHRSRGPAAAQSPLSRLK